MLDGSKKYWDTLQYESVELMELLKEGDSGTYWIAKTSDNKFIVVDEYYLEEKG